MLRTSLLAAAFVVGCMSAASAAIIEYHATLASNTEVPPNASGASGELLGRLDTASRQLSYTLTFAGLTGPAIAAHFHGPADPGTNAGVMVAIGTNLSSPVTATATLTDAQIKDLRAGKWYVNVHTEANKGGEIRGQMVQVK